MLDQRLLHHAYPLLLGLFLGVTQTGLFFQLSFTFSSSFRTLLQSPALTFVVGLSYSPTAFETKYLS